MSLLLTMTCPTGTTSNQRSTSLSLQSPSNDIQRTTAIEPHARHSRYQFGSARFGRALSPAILLTGIGLVALGCSDDGGGGGSGPSRRPNDDSEQNDNPRDKPDASDDDSDSSDDSDKTNDSDESDGTDDEPDASSDNGDTTNDDEPVSPDPKDLPEVDAEAEDSWTILVYMNGDNDLEHFALQDLVEMAQVSNHDDVKVLVQLDRAVDGFSPGYSSAELGPLGDFTSTKRLRMGENEVEELDDLGEVNMGDAETLSDFITWGIKEGKTGHYGLVFWDHGGGWDLFGPDDSHDHDGLDLPEIAAGLANGLKGAKREAKLDLVGFDACLMATFETAETVRPYASLLLASQELEPGSGWDWTALSTLTDDPTRSGRDFGAEVIERYSTHVGQTRNATLSLVDLGKLSDLKSAVDAFASDLAKVEPVVVGQVRAQSPEFASGHGKDLVDLGQLVTALAKADDDLQDSAEKVLGVLSDVIVSDYAGPDAGYANGLSLYFPLTPRSFNAEYAKLAGINGWQRYLTSYLDAGEEVGSLGGFTDPDKVGELGYDGGLLYITGNLAEGTANQIVSADLYFGMSVEGVLVFLGQSDGQWNDSQAVGAWDLTALVGYQGDVSAPFYYAQHYSSESQTYSFTTPVLYNGTYLLFYEMVLDSNFDLIAESYYGEIEGAIGQVAVPDSGTIQPVLLAMDGNGEVTEVPLDTTFDLGVSDISFSFEVLPEDSNVVMTLVITDLGGNTDAVYNETTL